MTKAEYQTYLESEHWQEFSRNVRLDRVKCEVCGIDNQTSLRKHNQRLNVHHKTYARIGKEKDEDVVLLCWACHLGAHGMSGWVDFIESHSMPWDIRKIPLNCANCEKPTGLYVWNFDEIYEVLCWECRA